MKLRIRPYHLPFSGNGWALDRKVWWWPFWFHVSCRRERAEVMEIARHLQQKKLDIVF